MKKILIIEDEINLANSIELFFKNENFQLIVVHDGKKSIDKFYNEKPDLVLLDINLPNMNGWEICNEIRSNSDTPVIMMTARDSEYDELRGLELGADDYITKPINLKILLARVKRILKIDDKSSYYYNGLGFDSRTLELTINNEKIELSPKESQILEYFIRNKGLVLSREKLINKIWGFDYEGEDRAVDTIIKRLRKKMGIFSERIKTLRGIGYSYDEDKA
ncbi:response regulator transcription factor [Cetobacterium somerae]|uniref:response regulator transcription factor n=1 Tax=Cetobacterium sp. NK01 TaxID=2993530 RepID=UPI0021165905|nr:response regulator transcription factor [Cetobacterium sp. NK01]MCQ8213403.1 response regulator transcription factor [Cetobacterium sp. NK01]